MPAYHVAAKELAGEISEYGLDPESGRAILLLAEPPHDACGFDVWEVEGDFDGLRDGDAVFCLDQVPAERLALLAERAAMPSMGI